MIELRGIAIDYPKGAKRVTLTIRSERGDDYTTLEYPSGEKLTRGAITNFLASELALKRNEVSIAPHVKIPDEK